MKTTIPEFTCITVGEIQTNTYLLHAEGESACMVVDPGDQADRIVMELRERKLTPEIIVLTHCHIDHTGGVSALVREFPVPVATHPLSARHLKSPFNAEMAAALGLEMPPAADRLLRHDEVLTVGGLSWRVIHTPGHSPGSISLISGKVLVSGDTLFSGSIGRTDLPGGDFAILQDSLQLLKALDPEVLVLPGHGETTTMEREIRLNPFL